MSRPAKKIEGDTLGAFFTMELVKFLKTWKCKEDLDNISWSLSKQDYPMVGNAQIVSALFKVAAFPEDINPVEKELFLQAYRCSPDAVLGLLQHLRSSLANSSEHRRHMLLKNSAAKGPKELFSEIGSKVELGTVKAERRKLRNITTEVKQKRKEEMLKMGFPLGTPGLE